MTRELSRPFLYFQVLGAALVLALVSGCALFTSRDAEKDGVPSRPISRVMEAPVPQPTWEPRSKLGNHSPYEVFGKTYHVLSSAEGYSETGIASWYGTKFHGRKTSTGEIYDVYKITAAHKSLPLPTWVKVTNLENDRTLVVRVNDRGPFKEGRVIDLSYAAAVKLGVYPKGTAKVRVEAIPIPRSDKRATPAGGEAREQGRFFVQAGAFRDRDKAARLERQLKARDLGRAFTRSSRADRLIRVLLGPFTTRLEAERAKVELDTSLGIRAIILD